MQRIDRLLQKARKIHSGNYVTVAFIERTSAKRWKITGRLSNGDIAYNENVLTTREEAEECVDALLEKHNQEARYPCIVISGEEELQD